METTYASVRIRPLPLPRPKRSRLRIALAVLSLSVIAAIAVSWLLEAPAGLPVQTEPRPPVPAKLGGIGFERIAEEEGWQTGTIAPEQFHLFADTAAIRGGVVTIGIDEFPATFRAYGRDENTQATRAVYNLVYEGLLTTSPLDLGFLPSLASHWKVSPDGRTFSFRIDPRARFSDGHPVTSEDVVATWKLGVDPGIESHSTNEFFREFEQPVAISPHIVTITAQTAGWRNLLYFGGTPILPAHVIGKLSGRQYLERFRYRMPPGSGPYVVNAKELKEGREVTLRRRSDWWAGNDPQWRGQFNFDAIRMVVYLDQRRALLAFLEGKIDLSMNAGIAHTLGEYEIDAVNQGLIISRKIHNDSPVGFGGLAFNTEHAPFDDIRVRKAIGLLFDREKLTENQVKNRPAMIRSIYPGSEFEHPGNPAPRFDPKEARRLLAEAGYSVRNDDGILVRNGAPLEVEMLIYPSQEWMTMTLEQDMLDAGIGITFRTVDEVTWFSMLKERSYQIASMYWGGLVYPNPETSFHSGLADMKPSNNITAFRSARVDELIEREKRSLDPAERRTLLREIDSIFTASAHYAYGWHTRFERLGHANRFGMPAFIISRIGDWRDALALWWVDPDRDALLKKARKDRSINLEEPPGTDEEFWRRWREREFSLAPSQQRVQPVDREE